MPKKTARKPWFVYILECGDGTLYTGITTDVDARLASHSEGRGAKYTRGRGPLSCVYRETCRGRKSALRREYAIKKLSRDEKLARIMLYKGMLKKERDL